MRVVAPAFYRMLTFMGKFPGRFVPAATSTAGSACRDCGRDHVHVVPGAGMDVFGETPPGGFGPHGLSLVQELASLTLGLHYGSAAG